MSVTRPDCATRLLVRTPSARNVRCLGIGDERRHTIGTGRRRAPWTPLVQGHMIGRTRPSLGRCP